MAYMRCLNKSLLKRKAKYEENLKSVNIEIADNNKIIDKMISSLEV